MARRPLSAGLVFIALAATGASAAPGAVYQQPAYPRASYPQPPSSSPSDPSPGTQGPDQPGRPVLLPTPPAVAPEAPEALDARRVARSLFKGRLTRSVNRLWMQEALDVFVRRRDLSGRRLRVWRSGRVAPIAFVCLADACRIAPRLRVRATRNRRGERRVERFARQARAVRLERGEGTKISVRLTRRQRRVVRRARRATMRIVLNVEATGNATYGSVLHRAGTFRIRMR